MQFSRSFLFAYLLVPVFCSCVRDVAMDAEEDPEVTVDIAPWPTQDVNGYIQIID